MGGCCSLALSWTGCCHCCRAGAGARADQPASLLLHKSALTALLGPLRILLACREFAKLGLTKSVGGVLALALSRELTPVVTSIIVAGRVGSAFAAELGTMQASGHAWQLGGSCVGGQSSLPLFSMCRGAGHHAGKRAGLLLALLGCVAVGGRSTVTHVLYWIVVALQQHSCGQQQLQQRRPFSEISLPSPFSAPPSRLLPGAGV